MSDQLLRIAVCQDEDLMRVLMTTLQHLQDTAPTPRDFVQLRELLSLDNVLCCAMTTR